jgi:hypothetical protein
VFDLAFLLLLLLILGTFDDFDLADLILVDLLPPMLPVFRLFNNLPVLSLVDENVLTLPLPAVFVDFKALIFGTFDDFPLIILLAFLILTDLLVTFKLFDDLTLPEEYTDERDNMAIAMNAKMDNIKCTLYFFIALLSLTIIIGLQIV